MKLLNLNIGIKIDNNLKVIDFKVLNSNASDHLPLMLEFEI